MTLNHIFDPLTQVVEVHGDRNDDRSHFLPSYLHSFSILPIDAVILRTRKTGATLAARTIMHHFVTKHIAVDAEVIFARLTLVPARLTSTLRSPSSFHCSTRSTMFRWRHGWESSQAAEALRAPLLSCAGPRYLDPVPEREEVVVRSSEMCRENECEIARRTRGGKIADLRLAATAQIATSGEVTVASTERSLFLDYARRKAHHQQCRFIPFLRFSICCADDGWCGDGHEDLAVVDLINGDVVGVVIPRVGLVADLRAYVHLGG